MQVATSYITPPRHQSARAQTQAQAPPEKELSVLVYLDGEGAELSQAASEALLNLELAGTDDSLNLVAQLGRKQGGIDGAWTGIRRYVVAHDNHHELRVSSEQWEEVVRAAPQNPIAVFHYARALAQEGRQAEADVALDKARELGYASYLKEPQREQSSAWRAEFLSCRERLVEEPEWKFSSPVHEQLEGSMQDPATFQDFLSWGMKQYPAKRTIVVAFGHGNGPFGLQGINPTDMASAVHRAVQVSGANRPETLALLACTTSSLETFYALRHSADFLVAPQNGLMSGAANRLGGFLKELKTSGLKGEDSARKLVETLSSGPGAQAGLTAVRTGHLEGLVRALESTQPQVGAGLVDLKALSDPDAIMAQATEQAVVTHQGSGSGISVWSPDAQEAAEGMEFYRHSAEAFAAASSWDEKLPAVPSSAML